MIFQVTIPIATNIGSSAPLDLGLYLSNIVGGVLTIAALAAFVYLLRGGLSWITAGGDTKKIEEARERITGAMIGLGVVAISWALFLIIDNFLGIGVAGGTSSNNSNTNTNSNSYTSSTAGTCIFPTSRCCNDVTNSSCFCQNVNYITATHGSCDAGGGKTGVRCECVPK